ncbi:hypothetical protein GCM10014715_04330 [Streptomyces spiralis]|uniref:Uncharacterized protein n=1 Tax=Streptomyces spiralis TaxID=66376 RepID=A0A919DKS3_9ACTN|nr:hypothetical protein GCM10014715_04330 [Streptomyces spiralis]
MWSCSSTSRGSGAGQSATAELDVLDAHLLGEVEDELAGPAALVPFVLEVVDGRAPVAECGQHSGLVRRGGPEVQDAPPRLEEPLDGLGERDVSGQLRIEIAAERKCVDDLSYRAFHLGIDLHMPLHRCGASFPAVGTD